MTQTEIQIQLLQHIQAQGPFDGLVDIGQLTKKELRALKNLIKKGEIVKVKAWWPWYTHGTIQKTYYQRAR